MTLDTFSAYRSSFLPYVVKLSEQNNYEAKNGYTVR